MTPDPALTFALEALGCRQLIHVLAQALNDHHRKARK